MKPAHSSVLASQTTPPPNPFIAGDHLALDFLNTIAAPRDAPIEWLGCGKDCLSWLGHLGVLDGAETAPIATAFPAGDLDKVAHEAMSLRDWFCDVSCRIMQNGRADLAPADLAGLNSVLSYDATFARLELSPDGMGVQMVSRCKNPVCTLWFYDRTKGHPRRWCSRAVCGNRAKVAAFRVRKRLEK